MDEAYLKDTLYQKLKAFQPINEQEASDQSVMLAYMEKFPDIYQRENVFAHMTSSPWIMNHTKDKVLMIYHNIYRSWGWCGGHCDGDHDSIHVALKEGKEETGLKNLKLVSEDILAIDILPVPPHKKNGKFVSAHVHLNVTYLCSADEQEALSIKPDENSGVAWIPIEEINDYVSEEDMKQVYKKLLKKAKNYEDMF